MNTMPTAVTPSVTRPLALSAAVIAAALLAPIAANAAILSTSGQVVQIAPPASAVYGALPGPPAFAWNEASGVSSTAVLVNTLGNGTFTGGSYSPTVYAGLLDSHMIHFDASTGVAVVQGSVTFSSNIVAVIYENNLLDISDGPLGAFGTTYATGDPFRSHSSMLGTTSYTVAGNVLTFTLWANSSPAWPNKMAELRVLTDAVPGPGAAALLGLAGLAGRRGRRR
jgi:MYXO-CTERM domain-containing protein